MSTHCDNCKAPNPPQRCSRCKSASYCSKDCQVTHWATHKANCKSSSKTEATRSPTLNPNTTSGSSSDVVHGVKLIAQNGPYTPSRFVPFEFSKNHNIFKLGEICPFTSLYGVPVILFSPSVHLGTREVNDIQDNQPAVYLRIDPDSGFAPPRWQLDYLGTCYAVRCDHKPLTPFDLEMMYAFHASKLSSDYFEYPMEKRPYKITPSLYQEFCNSYRKKNAQREGEEYDGYDLED